MAPIIGITTSRGRTSYGQPTATLGGAYIAAVIAAGGVPVLIPSSIDDEGWQSLYARLDGILFSGGGDIDPGRYGGDAHPRVYDLDSDRDVLELNLLRSAAADGKPFLGICRGFQLVNVGLGGSLYTHLPDQLPGALAHDQPENLRTLLVHEVQLEEDTRTAAVLGEPMLHVNSHHHQGLRSVGDGLRIAGRSPDGLVEAIELPSHPFGIAVQWHPEWLTDQPSARNLFSRFVVASKST